MEVAGVLHHGAAQAFALLFGLVQALVGLAHLGAGQAAAVDGDVQLKADAALLHVATEGGLAGQGRAGIAEAQAVVVALLVAGHRVQGRRMAGLALAQGLFGGIDGVVGGLQVEVLLGGGVDPGLGVVGGGHHDRQGVEDALDRGVFAVGQGHQGLEGVFHVALGDDPVGAGGVVAGLGFQHVGLVREADVEAFVGLVELALECRFFGLGRGQVVLGAQHGEIGFGGLQNQVLLGRGEVQGGLLGAELGSLQLEPAVGAEDRLAQGRLVGDAAAGKGVGGGVQLGPGVAGRGAAVDLRQQAGTGLGHGLALRFIVGASGGEVGVVVDSVLVDGHEVRLG
ncbi:hypothetical protein D9M71_261050 [compost metagenome]